MSDGFIYRMRSGPFFGQAITRVPSSRLHRLVRERHDEAQPAAAELERRGTPLPQLDISNHAIDRASQRCLKIWQATRIGDEGLYAWLHRMAVGACQQGVVQGGYRNYAGMWFLIDMDGAWPSVVTVRVKLSTNAAVREAKAALRKTEVA